MNFFEHQDKARKNTFLLIGYFSIAVILIVCAVNLVVYLAFTYASSGHTPVSLYDWATSKQAIIASLATLAVIGLSSISTFYQLLGGGESLAEMVGAREITATKKNDQERLLLNVVEEMAIASGMPRPRVYIMDHEQGLNAFVAGYEATETILVVTQGLLEAMTRDQLQGVVGHEFSHIFNGDMRINIRLIAILAGILAIGKVGQFMMRLSLYSGHRRNRNGGGSSVPVIILGLALTLIGYIGLFFGRLIKAAVSRQREFLADASAVQFTRNPSGIAEALLSIKNANTGSILQSSHSEDLSHMCFGQTMTIHLNKLLATHPPLEERIEAIDKRYMAIDRARNRQKAEKNVEKQTGVTPAAAMGFAGTSTINTSSPEVLTASASDMIASVGKPGPGHVEYAHTLFESINLEIKLKLQNPEGAKSAIYGLIIVNGQAQPAWDELKLSETKEILEKTESITPLLKEAGTRLRIPITDLAIPVLKQLDSKEREHFLEVINKLILADNKYTLFEFSLYSIFARHLDKNASKNHRAVYKSFAPVLKDINMLISLMTHVSGMPKQETRELHHKIMETFTGFNLQQQPAHACSAQELAKILQRLNCLSPLLKQPLLTACADAILDDNKIQVQEAELIRAIAESIDCPMPPLLDAS